MKKIAIIPARYASSRFPAKPLALLQGKPMVMWVYDAVKQSELFDRVIIATDDQRIESCVKTYGAEVAMTSSELSCGTQRCEAVLSMLESQGEKYDLVVNVQGDEPLISSGQLAKVLDLFDEEKCQIATLAKKIERLEELQSPNCVKLVKSDKKAIYFSRSIIPFQRGIKQEDYLQYHTYYKHIGLYGYRADVLHSIVRLQASLLETAESLEQLRWLENGFDISVAETEFESIGVDTPEDLERINEIL
jgi:3-deoxy-manno-octulosonate cytidylyltransferase (CMP-KDO synthetase)